MALKHCSSWFFRAALPILVVVCAPRSAAAPIWGEVREVRQPDGTLVSVKVWGDEYDQVIETLDGYTLVRDPQTREIRYAELSADGNELVATKYRVEKTKPDKVKIKPGLRIKPSAKAKKIKDERAIWAAYDPGAISGAQSPINPAYPSRPTPFTTGTVQGICLLVDFPDDPGTIPAANAANLCNQVGYTGYSNNGSVRDYYFDVSDDQLIYTNYVTPAYFRASHNKSYYDDPGIGYGIRARELIIEALNALEAGGFNFAPYDSNSDGWIDALNCYYAGTTTAGWSKGLWPHKSSLTWQADGVHACYYQICNMGTSLQIGTFCHENGHMLMGWPDLYDYGFESNGMGNYCLMSSSGSTNPVEPCAYLKLISGWANLTTFTDPAAGLQVRSGHNDIYKYPKPGAPGEFYLVENRQKSGRDASLPDAGLAILHVDTAGSNDFEQMTPTLHYLVTLVQADGRWDLEHKANNGDSTDLFDSATYNECMPWSTPNTNWWSGAASGLDINTIGASGSPMTFNFMEPYPLCVSPRQGLNSTGIKGQTFTPSSQDYGLTNSSETPINWTATKTASWLTLSKAGGTLSHDQTDTVTVTINALAAALNIGTYTDTVTFTDQATMNVIRRKVTLSVTDYHFAFDTIASPKAMNYAFPVMIRAVNNLGIVHDAFASTVSLRAYTGGTPLIGTGTSTWYFPFGTSYHDARLQVIYLASEIGNSGPISSISLEVTTLPGQVLNNWTIRMKHTALSSYATGAWESSGWTTVYQANQSVAQTGWVRFDFPSAFNYNGTDNLMIDFSYNNSSFTSDGATRYSTPGGYRSCYFRCDSTAGDPLTWSGSTPTANRSSFVPNIKLGMESPVSMTPAATGNFTQGVWTGQVTVTESRTGITLEASDNQGRSGTSNQFNTDPTPTISITVSPATWAIGAQVINYIGESGRYTVANNGNIAVNVAAKATDGAGGWVLGGARGPNTFRVETDLGGNGSYELSLQKTDQPFIIQLLSSTSQEFGLRYSAPTSDSMGGGVAQGFTVTFTASAYIP